MLSDDFERIVNEINLANNRSINEGLKEMVELGFAYIKNEISKDPETMLSAFQRVNNVWNFVAANAAKRGRKIMKIGGFKDMINSDDRFKDMHGLI